MLRENLERNFGFLVHDVARLMRIEFDRRVRQLGLTRSQWWVLTHLYRQNGATQSELAEVLEVERPTLGRLLDRLESNGWVRRVPDMRDRRVKRVYLTDEVEPAMQSLREQAAELRADATSGLSMEQQEQLVDVLRAIKSNLMNLDAQPEAPEPARAMRGART